MALRDPGDLRILDELFFVTGRKIIAGVAPEVRIYQALEKYYGERRTPRYAILAEKISRPARTAKAQAAALPPPPDFFPSPRRKRPGVVPSANDIWGDAGELDQGELPIIQSWTVPDQSIDQAVGGWAGSLSPGLDGLPVPEPETISWEEMPSIPGLWMPEPSSSASDSELPPSSSRDSGRILFDPRSLASSARAIPSQQVEASSAPPVSPTHSEIGPPPALPPEAASPPPLVREETGSAANQIMSAPAPTEPPRAAEPSAYTAPVAEETPPGPAPAEDAVRAVASAEPEAEEPVFFREPAGEPAPALPPSSPSEAAGEQAETAAEVSSIPSAPSAPAAPPVPEPELPPTEPLPVEPPQAVPPSPAPAPVSPAALAAMPSATDFPQVTSAVDRDAIATAALGALARRFVRAAVFVSRPDSVTAWGGLGEGVSAEELRDISIPWKDPSIFLNIRLSRSFYLGPLPPLPRHESIAIAMGGWPEECLIQPVYLKDRPVVFLYAEFSGDQGATPMDLAYMRELAAAASSAFVAAIRLKKREI